MAVTGAIIGFEVFNQRRVLRLQSHLGALTGKPLSFRRILVRIDGLDGIRPGFHFRRRFRRAVGVQPLGNLFVGLARAAYPAYLSPWPKRATRRSELPMLSKK